MNRQSPVAASRQGAAFLRDVCGALARRRYSLLALLLVFSGCASRPQSPAAPPQPYMRVARPDADTTRLDIAVRKFTPARGRGPSVWLVGASHIGEAAYYTALNRQLETHTIVLYEGVGEHARKPGQRTIPPKPPQQTTPADTKDDSLQATMATSLGLVFQLQAIDYDRTNFFNSDLSIEQIQALMQPPAPAQTTTKTVEPDNAFQDLLKAMDGSSVFGAFLNGLLQLIGTSPRLQALTKLALIEAFGAMEGDMSRMQGVPPEMKKLFEVLILERNKVVITDLKQELKRARPADSIAIFYGAGHLPDLEKRLRQELRYQPGEQIWLPVFSVNTTQAGVSNFELNLLRTFMRSQLGPAQAE